VVGAADIAELLTTTLELAGYRTSVADTGTRALASAAEHRYDLVVLDATLPDVPDLGHRPRPPVTHRPPVLFLTAYDCLGDLLPELGLGERDYVTKPFRVSEVLARMRVLLRGKGSTRHHGGAAGYLDLVLDDTLCRARRGTRTLDLTPAEYRLLSHLLANVHRVLSKEQISRHVWGDLRGDNAIEQLVSRLRRKVDQGGTRLVHTRRGFGYWLGRAEAED
jgi:two-component system OmpR family response regulator